MRWQAHINTTEQIHSIIISNDDYNTNITFQIKKDELIGYQNNKSFEYDIKNNTIYIWIKKPTSEMKIRFEEYNYVYL